MENRTKIDCSSAADQETLAVILFKCGYTVRQGREKRGKTSAYSYFVEYWK